MSPRCFKDFWQILTLNYIAQPILKVIDVCDDPLDLLFEQHFLHQRFFSSFNPVVECHRYDKIEAFIIFTYDIKRTNINLKFSRKLFLLSRF